MFEADEGTAVHRVSATLKNAWLNGKSLKAILETFSKKEKEEGGPMAPLLSSWVRNSPAALALFGGATFVFELALGPAYGLLSPPAYRVVPPNPEPTPC